MPLWRTHKSTLWQRTSCISRTSSTSTEVSETLPEVGTLLMSHAPDSACSPDPCNVLSHGACGATGLEGLLAVFREVDDALPPREGGSLWPAGLDRQQELAYPGGQPWLSGNTSTADLGTDDLALHGFAAHTLASLAASGLAAPLLPRDDAFAVYALGRAVEATDDLGARMAMADRLLQGRGVAQSCPAGVA